MGLLTYATETQRNQIKYSYAFCGSPRIIRTICIVLTKMFNHWCNNLYPFTICGEPCTIHGAHEQALIGPGYSNRSDCSPSALGEPPETYLVDMFAFDSPLGLI